MWWRASSEAWAAIRLREAWRSATLPYLDLSALAGQIDYAVAATDPRNQSAINVSVALFVCPSARDKRVPDIMADNDGAVSGTLPAALDDALAVTITDAEGHVQSKNVSRPM